MAHLVTNGAPDINVNLSIASYWSERQRRKRQPTVPFDPSSTVMPSSKRRRSRSAPAKSECLSTVYRENPQNMSKFRSVKGKTEIRVEAKCRKGVQKKKKTCKSRKKAGNSNNNLKCANVRNEGAFGSNCVTKPDANDNNFEGSSMAVKADIIMDYMHEFAVIDNASQPYVYNNDNHNNGDGCDRRQQNFRSFLQGNETSIANVEEIYVHQETIDEIPSSENDGTEIISECNTQSTASESNGDVTPDKIVAQSCSTVQRKITKDSISVHSAGKSSTSSARLHTAPSSELKLQVICQDVEILHSPLGSLTHCHQKFRPRRKAFVDPSEMEMELLPSLLSTSRSLIHEREEPFDLATLENDITAVVPAKGTESHRRRKITPIAGRKYSLKRRLTNVQIAEEERRLDKKYDFFLKKNARKKRNAPVLLHEQIQPSNTDDKCLEASQDQDRSMNQMESEIKPHDIIQSAIKDIYDESLSLGERSSVELEQFLERACATIQKLKESDIQEFADQKNRLYENARYDKAGVAAQYVNTRQYNRNFCEKRPIS